jgi:ATP-dependent Clp protease adaptor protein ClpS
MDDSQFTAVVEPAQAVITRKENRSRRRPKKLPPYAVIVLNDDEHTFQYVIDTFKKVFGYSISKGYLLAMRIHMTGRALVWSGSKEVAELKCEQIRSAGPDFYAERKVEYPLGVVIEPLPD